MAQALQLMRNELRSGAMDGQDVSRDRFEHCLRTQVCPCIVLGLDQ